MGHKIGFAALWGTPAAMLTCAGGFAFHGGRAWLNERVFCTDTELVCQQLGQMCPSERFVTTPRADVRDAGVRLKNVRDDAPFLATAPEGAWPSRAKRLGPPAPVDCTATGRRAIDEAERATLERALDEWAGALMGGTIFRTLASIRDDECGGRACTFAVVVRSDETRTTYAYDATTCAFVRGADDARATYLGGFECWRNLLAVLRGELGPIALTYNRCRLWNALPTRFELDVFGELYRMSHPLRRPAAYLATYERLWEGAKQTEPVIAGR